MIKVLAITLLTLGFVSAEETPITGNVESKCTIVTTVDGIYGNPLPNKLSTSPSDGGVIPVIRYDVVLADAYKAVITTPTMFSSSPTLTDTVAFTGDVSVKEVSDVGMAVYETNKITYNDTTEFDLTLAGSTWFQTTSTADYGFNKSFPGGTYRSFVRAECIAK